jgi:farnesyl-diphosphate farnesyltransferase
MMPDVDISDRQWCRDMLPLVSRTFAACIKLLPDGLDHAVLIAYLLCRIADTVEDTADLPLADKERLLADFRRCLENNDSAGSLNVAFAAARTDDERLAREADRTLREFRRLSDAQQNAIRPWVQEMCDGMAEFARHHARAKPGALEALGDVRDLDRYCYYVAGTVGHLLTELFKLHHHRVTKRHYQKLKALSTSFGLGLQLTNIIKDIADDRQRGWSFVPRQLCVIAGITPDQLLDPEHRPQAQRVMAQLIDKARGHLRDALEYCLCLPRSQYRIRLFCLTPLFFAVQTLRLAADNPRLLDPEHKVKITRAEVHRTIRMTFLVAPNNHLVRMYYRKLAGKAG